MDSSIKFDPKNPKVRDLRQLVSEAYEEFHQAHIAYEHALSMAGDPPNSSDMNSLQRAGREYAKAVTRHSHLVMTWLAMVDRSK